MLELLARLFRVLWRQDAEGSASTATVLTFPPTFQAVAVEPASAPVEFLRRSGEAAAPVRPAADAHRHLALQLQSVARINAASSRVRPKGVAVSGSKPRPVRSDPALKRSPVQKPGIVLGRLDRGGARGAEVVDLAKIRRAKQMDACNMDIAALFN